MPVFATLQRIPWQAWALLGFAAVLVGTYRHGVSTERQRWETRVAEMVAAVREREESDRLAVEEQNRADRETITQLEARLAAALAPRPDPAPRIVRVCDSRSGAAPSPEADAGAAGAGTAGGSPVRDAGDPGGDLQALRADLLTFATRCQADLQAALSAKEQWPR